MTYQGNVVTVNRVDNGLVLHVGAYGSGVTLVAKDQAEVLAIIGAIEFKAPTLSLDGDNMPNTASPGLAFR